MAFNTNFSRAGVQTGAGSLDAGLRAYMCRVFNWMALGLVITGLVAYGVAQTSLRALFFHLAEMPNGAIVLRPTLLGGISIFAPLVFVMVLSFGVNRLSRPAVQGIFLLFSAAMGASMASLLLSYTGVSVARTFFVTAITFAGMSLWGYTTGANLARTRFLPVHGADRDHSGVRGEHFPPQFAACHAGFHNRCGAFHPTGSV